MASALLLAPNMRIVMRLLSFSMEFSRFQVDASKNLECYKEV